MLCIAKVFGAFKKFKRSNDANPFGPLMKKYSWNILFKTVILGGYLSCVNFYNCPFELRIESCDKLEAYNFVFLIAFAVITRLFEAVNVCILSIQHQEREAAPVAAADATAVEPKKCGAARCIVKKSGKVIGFFGAIIVIHALYTGFHANSIATKALGISEDVEYVTRVQFAFSDNLKVISFFQIPIGFILMSFWRASRILTHGRWYWKCQCFKVIIMTALALTIRGFKSENHQLLGEGHHCNKFKMAVVTIVLGHIYFARRVAKANPATDGCGPCRWSCKPKTEATVEDVKK